jgi:hypothetical protein
MFSHQKVKISKRESRVSLCIMLFLCILVKYRLSIFNKHSFLYLFCSLLSFRTSKFCTSRPIVQVLLEIIIQFPDVHLGRKGRKEIQMDNVAIKGRNMDSKTTIFIKHPFLFSFSYIIVIHYIKILYLLTHCSVII